MASKACASSAELWVTMSAAAQRLLDNHWNNEAVSCFEKACAHFAGASDINDADLEVLDKAVKTFRVRFTRGSPTEHVQASVAAAFGAIERVLRVLPEDRVSFGDKIGGLGRELAMLASSVESRAEQDSVVAAASTWKPTHDAMSAWHGLGTTDAARVKTDEPRGYPTLFAFLQAIAAAKEKHAVCAGLRESAFAATIMKWDKQLRESVKPLVLTQREDAVLEKRAQVAALIETPSKTYWDNGLDHGATLEDVIVVAKELLMNIDPAVDSHLQALATKKGELLKAYGAFDEQPPPELIDEILSTSSRGHAAKIAAMMVNAMIEYKDKPTTLKKKLWRWRKLAEEDDQVVDMIPLALWREVIAATASRGA